MLKIHKRYTTNTHKMYKINKSLKIIKKVFTSPNENVTVRTSQGTGGLATAAKFGKAAANASSAIAQNVHSIVCPLLVNTI